MSDLRPRISLPAGIALAVGMVVGSGMFGLPGLALQAGSPQVVAMGWLSSALASLPLVAIFAVLGGRYRSSAGLARYAEVALGGWANKAVTAVLCGTFPLGIPALAMIGASYALPFLGAGPDWILPVAALFILLAVLGNLVGIRTSSAINGMSLILMAGIVVSLGGLHADDLARGLGLWLHPDWSDLGPAALWKVSALLFWAFLGWENLSFGLEEFSNPRRTIPRVYILSVLIVFLFYGLLAATMNGAALAGAAVNKTEGIATLVPGPWRLPFTLATIVVILANANAWVFGASRLFFAAGRSGFLSARMGMLDGRGVPRNAILFAGGCFFVIIVVIRVFRLEISDLVLIVSQNFLVLYLACVLCFWKTARGWKRWIITAFAAISCCFLLSGFNSRILYPLGLILAGALRHHSWRRGTTGAWPWLIRRFGQRTGRERASKSTTR
jgi:amino acid transporter